MANMGGKLSIKKSKNRRVQSRFVKPWRHEESPYISRVADCHGHKTVHANESSEEDIWIQRRTLDVKCLEEYNYLATSEKVVVYRETVLNEGFDKVVESTAYYDSVNDYAMDSNYEDGYTYDEDLRRKKTRLPPRPYQINPKEGRKIAVVDEEHEEELYELEDDEEEETFKAPDPPPPPPPPLPIWPNNIQLRRNKSRLPPPPLLYQINPKGEREVAVEDEEELYEDWDSDILPSNNLLRRIDNRPPLPLPFQMNPKAERDVTVEVVGKNEEEDDDEREMYSDSDICPNNNQLTRNKTRLLPPSPYHINLKEEREVAVVDEEELYELEDDEEEELYEDPELTPPPLPIWPNNIQDIADESMASLDFNEITPSDTSGCLYGAEDSKAIVYESDTQVAIGDENCYVNSSEETQAPQLTQRKDTQVVGEVDIIQIKEEEAPPPPPKRNVGRLHRLRRHRYEETIILHRQVIVRDVIVSQVLPHLHMCLSKSDISAIKGETDQHKAVELLLDKLTACEEPGKWKMFVEALEVCGHKAIVDALKRKRVPDSNKEENILHIFSSKLREMIVPSEIMTALLSTDVINSDDRYEIQQKELYVGPLAAADLLLDRIPRKHPDWFQNFLKSLQSIDRHDLADMLTDGNGTESKADNQEEDGSVSSDEDTDTTQLKCAFKYESLWNEQQAPNESMENDVNTESTYLEYSEAYESVCLNKKKQEHCDPNDETLEKKTMEADKNIQQSKRKIEYTPVETDGQFCTVNDESATGEWKLPLGEKPGCESFLSGFMRLTEAQSRNIQTLREKKKALVAEGSALELEMLEYEDILNAHEKNNQLLNRKRNFCEQVKIKEKEAAALKAAISGEDIEDDKFRYQSAASLEDMAQYIAPGRRSVTWDFRDIDVSAPILPNSIPIDIGTTMPVKLYDVDQTYKDSAFYSEYWPTTDLS